MAKENITPGWDENLINIGEDPSRYGFTAPTGASTQAIVYYDRQGNKVNYGSPDAYFTSPTGGYTYQGFPSGGVENTGLIYEDDPIFQDPYLVQLDEGVKVNPKDYGWKKSAYDYYLGGGLDDYIAGSDPLTETVDTSVGTGGEGSGPVLPYMDVDGPKNTLADIDPGVGEFDDLGPFDTGGDTIMPPMLDQTGQMGMDTVVDTTPDYSLLDHSGHPMAKTTPTIDMSGNPFGYEDPVNLVERDPMGHPMAKETVGTTPPDTIGPQPVNIVEPDIGSQHPLNLMSAKVPPAIETIPPEFVTGIQPEEETYADLLERTPMNLVRGPSGVEFTVNPETEVVQPGIVEDIVEEPEYSVTRPAGIDAPMISPEQTTFGDPIDVEQGFTADPIDFSAPGTLADPAEKQDIESLPAQEQDTFLSDIANQLGGIWDNTSKTIDIAGQKINPFVAGVKGAINKYIFGGLPVTFVFDALGAMGIKPGYSDQTKAAQYIGLAKEGETQDIYGINTQSMFGDYDQYNVDRVEELEDIVADQISRGLTNTIQMQELEKRNTYNRMASGDIDDDPTGDAQIAEDIALQDRIDAGIEAADEEPGAMIGDTQEIIPYGPVTQGNIIEEQIKSAEEKEMLAELAAEEKARAEAAANAREQAAQRAREAAAAAANQGGGNNRDSSGTGGGWGQSATGGGWCFDPNTFVQMSDGSEKKIKEIQLGDNTKGGEVTGVFQFKAADEIHDYKGVTVAGSHYVKENGKFIMVQDSPLAVKIDKIPVVYSLDTTGRRIFIKGIEFADYNGDGIAKGFLHNAGLELNGFNKEVLRQVENRLI